MTKILPREVRVRLEKTKKLYFGVKCAAHRLTVRSAVLRRHFVLGLIPRPW